MLRDRTLYGSPHTANSLAASLQADIAAIDGEIDRLENFQAFEPQARLGELYNQRHWLYERISRLTAYNG